MTPERDVVPAKPQPYPAAPVRALDDEAVRASQEINERRARIESPERLRHLRSL